MDRPLHHPRRSRLLVAVATAGVVAVCLAPVAAAGTWLLVTDPLVAADVAAEGSLVPVAEALMKIVGQALADLLAYL
ncbi:MAG: hypothetical protein OEW19_07755 [Acidobacteriota bacterium]|jgi:hypothetical protein|nr:hypothetical protein [Acidobacteriota bacterium]